MYNDDELVNDLINKPPFPESKEASIKTAEEYTERPSGIMVPRELEEELNPEGLSEIPTTYKEYKKAPHGMGGEVPEQATTEMASAYQEFKQNRNIITSIDATINQIRADIQKQIDEAKSTGKYNEAAINASSALNALSTLMSKAKTDLITVEGRIINLHEETLKHPSGLSAAAQVAILIKHFGENATKVLEEAQAKANTLAEQMPTTQKREIRDYPVRKPASIIQAALQHKAFQDILQSLGQTLNQLLDLIQNTNMQVEQLELAL